ncbi:hypothetical protein MMC21_005244 [Puttea exsequens]|nr:hypothetical protein [Puttea exsequens]
MLDQHWDLYFEGMVRAHRLVDAGEMGVESFRNKMLVHSLQWGWLVWEVWRTTELVTEDEGTRKLQAIKDRLTGMGKENLFFRWIEVVQSETNAPGGFTAERREKAVRNVREEFERQGVDFEEFWGEVGGVENMPGMELTG